MNIKKIVAAGMATMLLLAGTTPALAATVEKDVKTADLVFYRSKTREIFQGSIPLAGQTTDVSFLPGGDEPFTISAWEKGELELEDIYKSGETGLVVTKDGTAEETTVGIAVYDSVTIDQDGGSVTLTVKDSKTLKPIAGAGYALYSGSGKAQDYLTSDKSGEVTVAGLAPGTYELRQTSGVKGYKSAFDPVAFTIGGVELSGGDLFVRTSSGKRVAAEAGEILIAGQFSPDVELTPDENAQVESVVLNLENYGAGLGSTGGMESRTFPTVKEAETWLNEAKNNGEVCGSVAVHVKRKASQGKSTCNFTQYLEAEKTPVTSNNGNSESNGGNGGNSGNNGNGSTGNSGNSGQNTGTVKPTPMPTPQTSTTGFVTIKAECSGVAIPDVTCKLIGMTATGAGIEKIYMTDSVGQITIDDVPAGEYQLSVLPNAATAQYATPYDQRVSVGVGGRSAVTLSFSKLRSTISGLVVDEDGLPLENISVGLFEKGASEHQQDLSGSFHSEDEVEDISGSTYYNAGNALDAAVTNRDGRFSFSHVSLGEYEIMPLLSKGYYAPDEPCSVVLDADGSDSSVIEVRTTRVSVQFFGKNGGKLTGRTVRLNDGSSTVWTMSEEPMILKGLIPGEYIMTVSEGKDDEPIDPVTFTVEDSPETLVLEVETEAVIGEVDVPEQPESSAPVPDELESGANSTQQILGLVLVVLGLGLLVAIMILKIKKKKPQKGGIK